MTRKPLWESRWRWALRLGSAAATAALLIGQAGAAEDAQPAAAPTQVAQAAPAQTAQAAPGGGSQLQEIVVTAEYKKENLQTTPLAISAFTGEELEDRNNTNIKDLGEFVPNTVIEQLGPGWGSTISAFIRGVGLADNSLSFEPGVPIYIDGVYNGRPQAAQLDLLDLDNVQVLRGPQGTLFGKNAIGGAISMISKPATGDGSGYVEATTGSYNRLEGRGALDVAIIPDVLMMRVAFSDKNQDGYGDILDYTCATGIAIPGGNGESPIGPTPIIPIPSAVPKGHSCVVGHQGGVDDKAGRVELHFKPSENLDINLIGDYTNQNDQGPVSKYLATDNPPNGLIGLYNTFVALPVFGIPLGNQFLTSGRYTNYETFSDPLTGLNFPNVDDVIHYGINGTIDYNIPDLMNIKSITAFRSFDNTFGRNSDGSPLPFDRTENETRHEQYSTELDLTGTAFSHLDWVVGLYYYGSTDSDTGTTILNPFDPIVPLSANAEDIIVDTDLAAFAHGIYHFDDQWSLSAGIRYTRDDKTATIHQYGCCGFDDGAPIIPDAVVQIGATRWSPQVELAYQWTPDLMTYAEYSTGFRGGGFGPRPSDAYQVQSFAPEDLETWEVGEKSEWFEHRMMLNGAFFYSNYTNQQIGYNHAQPAGTLGPGGVLITPESEITSPVSWFQTINSGVSRIWGFEGELQAHPWDGMLVQGSVGYTNYFRTSLGKLAGLTPPALCQTTVAGVGPTGQVAQVGGITCYPPRTPKWNFAIGVQQAVPLGDNGDMGTVTPRVDVTYQSAVFFTDNFNIGQPGYAVVNARTTWDSPDGLWSVAAFGTNIFNKYYYYGALELQGVLGFNQANPAPPAEWGLTVKRTFSLAPAPAAYTPPPVPAPTPAPPAAPVPAPEAQRSFEVFFDFDKSDITSAAAAVIQAAADAVKAGQNVRVTVTGHTDTVGTAQYNQALSERRASAVKRQLVSDGVDAGGITTIGVGKTGLLVPTADGVREPQNRRAEIVLQ